MVLRHCEIIVNKAIKNDASFDRHMHPSLAEQKSFTSRAIPVRTEELEINYWKQNAQNHLKQLLKTDSYVTPKQAKNVILFLGDGMSLATVAATRMYLGGEDKSVSFERFPHFGLSKVRAFRQYWFLKSRKTKNSMKIS